jgi:polysaccharide pyruvyl transferase WcaK-like protein
MLVVSARAHGVILPAIFGIPGIAVEIEPKLVNVHRMLPRGTKLWQKPFNPDSLLKMIQEMLENNDEFRRLVNEDVSYNHNIALEAKADIQRFIRDYLKKQHHV